VKTQATVIKEQYARIEQLETADKEALARKLREKEVFATLFLLRHTHSSSQLSIFVTGTGFNQLSATYLEFPLLSMFSLGSRYQYHVLKCSNPPFSFSHVLAFLLLASTSQLNSSLMSFSCATIVYASHYTSTNLTCLLKQSNLATLNTSLLRENTLIATAWYDLNTRLQQSNISISASTARREPPRGWLGRQRVGVEGVMGLSAGR
jgi:hypothetical protein